MIDPEKLKKRALTRLLVIFNDGNERYFWAIDDANCLKREDPSSGITRFITMLNTTFHKKWKFAQVYGHRLQSGQLLLQFDPYTIKYVKF